jgi:hypothetical protein
VQAIHIRGLINICHGKYPPAEDENDVRPVVRHGGASVSERKSAGAN